MVSVGVGLHTQQVPRSPSQSSLHWQRAVVFPSPPEQLLIINTKLVAHSLLTSYSFIIITIKSKSLCDTPDWTKIILRNGR